MITHNLSKGRYAITLTEKLMQGKGWTPIGDGIISPNASLVTRAKTREDAESIATALRSRYPKMRFDIRLYRRLDYITEIQFRHHLTGCRDQSMVDLREKSE